MKIEIDQLFPLIRIDGREIAFSRREYELFIFLWGNRGRTCTRDVIQTSIWGTDNFNSDRAIDVTVLRLRKKLLDTAMFGKLITRKGFGYSMLQN